MDPRAETQFSDEDFCNRVRARCAELRLSVRKVLRDAQIAHDFLNKPPARGRRIDTMERLAHALGWTLSDIMGFGPGVIYQAGRADQDLMRHAVEVKREVMIAGRSSVDLTTEAHILTTIYNVLARQRAKGIWPIPRELIDMMGSTLIEQQRYIAQLPQEAEENNDNLVNS